MTGKEELGLWAYDGVVNLLDECVTAYGVTRQEAAQILKAEMEKFACE